MRKLTLLMASFVALAHGATAFAGTSTDNLSISATVSDSCTITGGSLAFGTYDTVSGSAVDGSGTVSVACTKDATATITMDQGLNADAASTDTAPLRRMTDSTNFLSYSLYTDSGRTTVWGNTSGTGKSYTAADSNSSDLTVYGTISASQDVPAGSYTDTVVATITF